MLVNKKIESIKLVQALGILDLAHNILKNIKTRGK